MSDAAAKFYERHMAQVVGGTILEIVLDDKNGFPVWGWLVEKNGERKIIWILSDEEGNGPGFPEIENLDERSEQ